MKQVLSFFGTVFKNVWDEHDCFVPLLNIVVSSFVLALLCYYDFAGSSGYWAFIGVFAGSLGNLAGFFVVEFVALIFKNIVPTLGG